MKRDVCDACFGSGLLDGVDDDYGRTSPCEFCPAEERDTLPPSGLDVATIPAPAPEGCAS